MIQPTDKSFILRYSTLYSTSSYLKDG